MIITLTTDFGLADHYIGTMKGVISSRCPSAHLVDITHEIPPFSLYSGAYAIAQAAPYFPAGTVHLVVVDPGVGTSRKSLVVQALGQIFVAPDNGVLSLIFALEPDAAVRELVNPKHSLANPSNTFHGRDLFAPAAAALANGDVSWADIGPETMDFQMLPDLQPIKTESGAWQGRVLSIDRFGNVITNFPARDFRQIQSGPFELLLKAASLTNFRRTFGDSLDEKPFAYFGSSGYVEVAINQRNASRALGVDAGDPVQLYC